MAPLLVVDNLEDNLEAGCLCRSRRRWGEREVAQRTQRVALHDLQLVKCGARWLTCKPARAPNVPLNGLAEMLPGLVFLRAAPPRRKQKPRQALGVERRIAVSARCRRDERRRVEIRIEGRRDHVAAWFWRVPAFRRPDEALRQTHGNHAALEVCSRHRDAWPRRRQLPHVVIRMQVVEVNDVEALAHEGHNASHARCGAILAALLHRVLRCFGGRSWPIRRRITTADERHECAVRGASQPSERLNARPRRCICTRAGSDAELAVDSGMPMNARACAVVRRHRHEEAHRLIAVAIARTQHIANIKRHSMHSLRQAAKRRHPRRRRGGASTRRRARGSGVAANCNGVHGGPFLRRAARANQRVDARAPAWLRLL